MADASEEHYVKSAGTFPVSSRSQTNVLWSAWKHKAPVNCPNKIHPSRSVYGRYCAPNNVPLTLFWRMVKVSLGETQAIADKMDKMAVS